MSEVLKKLQLPDLAESAFGVYVHWPFCASKCPYCDFNSHVRREGVDQQEYLKAYCAEINHIARLTPDKTVTSIFFGGGTPSLMAPETVHAIIETISSCWSLDDRVEISLEANPSSVEASRFSDYRTAGINRVSLGIQSLDDERLRFLGRLHSAKEALEAIETAAAHFSRYSLDFIYATPGQGPDEWTKELETAIAVSAGHLSLYQLTFEPGTPFYALRNLGKITANGDDSSAELYEQTQDITASHGLYAYEVSNHARFGEECRHNLVYWRGQEYVGIGPGAHGRIQSADGRIATECIKNPETWCMQAIAKGHGLHTAATLNSNQQADELAVMSLRLTEGLRLDKYEKLAAQVVSPETLEHLMSLGLIEMPEENRVRATAQGRLVLNSIVVELTRTAA